MYCRIGYKKLLRDIGLQDTFIELNELSQRYFEVKMIEYGNLKEKEFIKLNQELPQKKLVIEVAKYKKAKEKEFIDIQSKKYKISVNSDLKEKMRILFAKNYIAMTYNSFEIFFDDFRKEYNQFNNTGDSFDYELTLKKNVKITRFEFLLKKFPLLNAKIPTNHKNLYYYFKEIRTNTTHAKSDKSKIEDLYKKLELDTVEFSSSKKRKEFTFKTLPKQHQKLDFDDWLIFTKLIKSIALEISKITNPSPEKLIKKYNLKQLNRYKTKTKRKEAVKKTIWSDFFVEDNFDFFNKIDILL